MAAHQGNPLDGFQGFEWDENKRRKNVQKHHLDFLDAIAVFNDPNALIVRSLVATDVPRFLIVGLAVNKTISVVFTRRGPAVRLISARIARRAERKSYDAHQQDSG